MPIVIMAMDQPIYFALVLSTSAAVSFLYCPAGWIARTSRSASRETQLDAAPGSCWPVMVVKWTSVMQNILMLERFCLDICASTCSCPDSSHVCGSNCLQELVSFRFFFVAPTISHVAQYTNSVNPRWKISNCKSRSLAGQEYSWSLLQMFGVKSPVWPLTRKTALSWKLQKHTAGRFMEDPGWNRSRKVRHPTVNGLVLEGKTMFW